MTLNAPGSSSGNAVARRWPSRCNPPTRLARRILPSRRRPHGKALIVCSTREICANLYTEIIRLRPQRHSRDISSGTIKVVYSGTASDQPPISDHVRRDSENKVIKNRLKDIDDELELVIVKDMLLTGFDAPPLHTLYIDRPLKGALLMQTLARVNRTFRGKQDGLMTAYAPLAANLREALQEYSPSDQRDRPMGRDIDQAAQATRELVEALRLLLAGFDWRSILADKDPARNRKAVGGAVNYLRSVHTPGNQVPEGEPTLADRFRTLSARLGRMWALASGVEALADLRHEVRFYEEVRTWMAKYDAMERKANGEAIPEEIVRVLRSTVAQATAAGEITDIYDVAGLDRPDIHSLNPGMLEKAAVGDQAHLAIEALRALRAEIKRLLRRRNYPPDKQPAAVKLVIEQMELLTPRYAGR